MKKLLIITNTVSAEFIDDKRIKGNFLPTEYTRLDGFNESIEKLINKKIN